MVVEYTSITQDVRELASSVLSADFPDAEIIEEQEAAYNHIAVRTHKFDWTVSDPEFKSIQKIEARLAKCYIFDHYGGVKYREQMAYEEDKLDKEIDTIKDNMESISPDEEDTLTRTDFKSWNLNPDEGYQSKLSNALRADTMGVSD
jgi:hypothetical protein